MIEHIYQLMCNGHTVREAMVLLNCMECEKEVVKQLHDEYGEGQIGAIISKEVFPGLLKRSKHLTKGALKVLASGVACVAEDTRRHRESVCNSCTSQMFGKCKHCACPTRNVVRFTKSECPESKW